MKQFAVLIVAGSALLAFQQETRFGNAVFRTPAGWRAEQVRGGMAVRPGQLSSGEEFFILFTPGRALTGDFQAEFDFWVHAVIPRDAPGDHGAVQSIQAEGMQVLSQVITLASQTQRQLWMFVAMNPGGRFESYLVAAAPASLYQKYQRELQSLVDSLSYQPASAAPGPAAAPLPARAPTPGASRPQSYTPAQPQAGPGVYDGAAQSRPTASPAPGGPAPLAPLQPRPGWAIGRAVYADGKPI